MIRDIAVKMFAVNVEFQVVAFLETNWPESKIPYQIDYFRSIAVR